MIVIQINNNNNYKKITTTKKYPQYVDMGECTCLVLICSFVMVFSTDITKPKARFCIPT